MQFVTVRKFRCLRKSTSTSFIFSEKTVGKKLVSIYSKSLNIIKVFPHEVLKKSPEVLGSLLKYLKSYSDSKSTRVESAPPPVWRGLKIWNKLLKVTVVEKKDLLLDPPSQPPPAQRQTHTRTHSLERPGVNPAQIGVQLCRLSLRKFSHDLCVRLLLLNLCVKGKWEIEVSNNG